MEIKKDLKDIAEVIAGYSFRTAIQGKEDASLFALQAKNILDGSTVDENNLDGIDFENYRSKAIVKRGDVVVSSRGSFRAGSVSSKSKNIIAASSVYILRIKNEGVLPEYLAIYMNSIEGQKQLIESATGAAVKAIRKNDLENISVVVPRVETQEKIIRLYHTGKKLQEALIKKAKLINNVIEVVINKLLNN